MRPVLTGDGTTYKAKVPEKFDFSSYGEDKKNLIKRYFSNKLAVATGDCLNFWLQIVKAEIEKKKKKDRTPDDNDRLTVKNMILDKVTAIYKQAGIPMVQTIGDFCCYCDTAVPGLLEVEHVCPKSQYPTFAMEWGNFQISCGPCNNTKRDNPDRDTVATWSVPAPDTEADYSTLIAAHYVWSNIYPNPYTYIQPYLYCYDTTSATWHEVPADYAFNLNNILVSYDLATRVVKANLYADGKAPILDVQVAVLVKKMTADVQTAIVDLCGLNNPGNTDSTYDRRMVNRTKAWFTVLATMKPFSSIDFSGPHGQQIFDMLWNSVLITAASTGFFSVWYLILSRLTDPAGNNLGKRFVLESKDPNFFPGTNTKFVE